MGQWQINLDLTGVKPNRPGTYRRPPTGGYKAKTMNTEQVAQKEHADRFNIEFTEEITEGNFVGTQYKIRVPVDAFCKHPTTGDAETDRNNAFKESIARACLEAHGYRPEVLDTQKGPLMANQFEGKVALIWIEQPEETPAGEGGKKEKKYADVNFISVADYTERARKAQLKSQQTPTTGLTPAMPALGAAPAATPLGSLSSFAPGGAPAPSNGVQAPVNLG